MPEKRRLRPVTSETKADVARLAAEGFGRNEIARRLTRSPRTISVICEELGISFDRTATEAATRARMADLAERRTALAEALQGDAERLSAQLWEPALIYNFGGKDNTYEERQVDEPPAADKRQLMAAAGMAIDRSLRLVPAAVQTGEDEARSMLGKVMVGLTTLWNEQQAGEGEGDDAQ